MLAFLFGVIVGAISGALTFAHTDQAALAALVGGICFIVAWLLGVGIFTDGDGWDIDF